jgi:protoheme IX farnesyltransferase
MKSQDAAASAVSIPVSTVRAALWSQYFALTKPTISLLVVVTALPSFLMATPGVIPSVRVIFGTLLGTWFASGSAAVFNQLMDARIDAVMARTQKRPLPAQSIQPWQASLFGVVMGIAALICLTHFGTPLAAVIALVAHAFYVLFYTGFLKHRTDQNIVIGGAAGAVGPLIGWAAVTGTLAWPAWVLFGVIFLWTPPHFWALAIKYKDDYGAAGVPMLPVTRGEEVTRWQIFWYTWTLIPACLALWIGGAAGVFFGVTSLLLNLRFLQLAAQLLKVKTVPAAMKVFHYSCVYLFGIFGFLLIDRLF